VFVKRIAKTIRLILAAFVFVTLATVGLSSTTSAYSLQEGVNSAHGNGQPTELFGAGGVINTITNVLLFVVGALSVIMIIIGGLRYVISGGNATSVTAARNTILYAIVGLVIAFLAFAAINFVLINLSPGSSGAGAGYTDV
jgi:hypothetical protein